MNKKSQKITQILLRIIYKNNNKTTLLHGFKHYNRMIPDNQNIFENSNGIKSIVYLIESKQEILITFR